MKKKLFTGFVTLLAVSTLVACSSNKADSKPSASSAASSAKASSSSSEAASSSSSQAATKELKPSTVTYLSDEEIAAMKTLGDYKKAFSSLGEAYIKDFEELKAQLPEEAQEVLASVRSELDTAFAEQEKLIAEQITAAGGEATEIPAESHEAMVSSITMIRDHFKRTVEQMREQAATMLEE